MTEASILGTPEIPETPTKRFTSSIRAGMRLGAVRWAPEAPRAKLETGPRV